MNNHISSIKNVEKSLCQSDLLKNIKTLVIIIFELNMAVFFEHFKKRISHRCPKTPLSEFFDTVANVRSLKCSYRVPQEDLSILTLS